MRAACRSFRWSGDAVHVGISIACLIAEDLLNRASRAGPGNGAPAWARDRSHAQPGFRARSGRHPALLPGTPLRTGRESFPSSGSSRMCLFAVSCVMSVVAPPMHHHEIVGIVVTASPFGMTVVDVDLGIVPQGIERHVAHGAAPLLTFEQEPSVRSGDFREPRSQLPSLPVFRFIRIHRSHVPMYLEVAAHRRLCMIRKLNAFTRFFPLPEKYPLPLTNPHEISPSDPLARLLAMSSAGPFP